MQTWSLTFLAACGIVGIGAADDALLQLLGRLILLSALAVGLLAGALRIGRIMAGYDRLLPREAVVPLRSAEPPSIIRDPCNRAPRR